MAVHKRGYQRFQGPYTGYLERLLAYPRYAWRRLFERRLVVIATIVAMFWPLLCGLFIYFSNNLEMLGLPQTHDGPFGMFHVDGRFFVVFMNGQAITAVLLAALAGPGLIAPDVANNGLQLYFSRPLSRFDYVLARMLVLAGLLSAITWIPGLALFVLQASLAGWDWFLAHWTWAGSVVLGFWLWILLVSLVALAGSAYVRWRIIASGFVIGFFFVLSGASEIMNNVLRVQWGTLFNPTGSVNRIWNAMFGIEMPEGPGPLASGIALTVMAALLCAVLERKLRPVEVVR